MGYAAPRTTYKFSGLSPEAQERALEKLYDVNVFYDWWDSDYHDFTNIAEILGIDLKQKRVTLMNGSTRLDPEIWFTGLDGNGGCSFRASYSYAKCSQRKIRDYAPLDTELHRIADELFKAQSLCFFSVNASIVPACRESCIKIEWLERHDGKEFPKKAEDSITEALEDFNHWMFKQLRSQYEYLTSEEAIKESIEANDYDFDEHGNMV